MDVQDRAPYVQDTFRGPKLKDHRNLATELLDQEARGLAQRAAARLLNDKKRNEQTFLTAWRQPGKRKAAIKAQARKEAEEMSSRAWNEYRLKRAVAHPTQHRPIALEEDWGPQSLAHYTDLTRAESTLLLELRTERIGLNGPLHDMWAQREIVSDAPVTTTSNTATPSGSATAPAKERVPQACPCGHRKQTVYHMFFHCPNLSTARRQLVDVIGELNWNTLLTVHAKTATQWAMVHFPLGQYDFVCEDSPFYVEPVEPVSA